MDGLGCASDGYSQKPTALFIFGAQQEFCNIFVFDKNVRQSILNPRKKTMQPA
jgi:hypothetical protein